MNKYAAYINITTQSFVREIISWFLILAIIDLFIIQTKYRQGLARNHGRVVNNILV